MKEFPIGTKLILSIGTIKILDKNALIGTWEEITNKWTGIYRTLHIASVATRSAQYALHYHQYKLSHTHSFSTSHSHSAYQEYNSKDKGSSLFSASYYGDYVNGTYTSGMYGLSYTVYTGGAPSVDNNVTNASSGRAPSVTFRLIKRIG